MVSPSPSNCGISIVTLGVEELKTSQEFYSSVMGWRVSSASTEGIVFLDAGTCVLALYGRKALAEDANLSPQGEGFRCLVLACNRPSKPEVDQLMQSAAKHGGSITQAARDTFWGGYAGCFADPDGHIWEVAWAPGFPLSPQGKIDLP